MIDAVEECHASPGISIAFFWGQMKVIAFITDYPVVDRIIRHLKLSFQPERPPPPQFTQPELLMAAEEKDEYF
jgi:hypothetical protein